MTVILWSGMLDFVDLAGARALYFSHDQTAYEQTAYEQTAYKSNV